MKKRFGFKERVSIGILLLIAIFLIVYLLFSFIFHVDFFGRRLFFSPGCSLISISNSVGNYNDVSYSLAIDECSGNVTSLLYNGTQALFLNTSLSRYFLVNGTIIPSVGVTSLGNNLYNLSYLTNDSLSSVVEIVPRPNYITFRIVSVSIPQGYDMLSLDVYWIRPKEIPQGNYYENWAWTLNATDNELFLNSLPLTVDTLCMLHPGIYHVSESVPRDREEYRCWANKFLMTDDRLLFVNTSAALVIAPKKNYNDAIKQIVYDYQNASNPLPLAILSDGKWLRDSIQPRESYLFTEGYGPSDMQKVSEYAQLGKFKQLLLIDPLHYGYYNWPWRQTTTYPGGFANYSEFNMSIHAIENAGVKVGIHTFLNLAFPPYGTAKSVVDYKNPSKPLIGSIYTYELANISRSISNSNGYFNLSFSTNLSNNSAFAYYYLPSGLGYTSKPRILIDNELILCGSFYNETALFNCQRGWDTTIISPHNSGARAYIVPYIIGHFLKPGSEAHNISTLSFAQTMRDLNASMIYLDGTVFVGVPGLDSILILEQRYYILEKKGYMPYLMKIQELYGSIPFIQGAGGGYPYEWFYQRRAATYDGVVFKAKQFTRWKAETVLKSNPYNQIKPEIGWWKINGAEFSSKIWDFDATSYDDIHYAMTKAFALKTSMGLQLSTFFKNNSRLSDYFRIVGTYNDLIEEDYSLNITPILVRNYLEQTDNEAELNHISGYNFVRKSVNYTSMGPEGFATSFDNIYGRQPIRLELRARFDYYLFNDTRNILINNFSNNSQFSITTSNPKVKCNISSEGDFIVNTTLLPYYIARVGGCHLYLPGVFNLTGKRGIGIRVLGDAKNETLIIRLGDDFSVRDFKTEINFSGERTIIFPEATGDNVDYNEQGIVTSWDGYGGKNRHWNYNYNSATISIFVNNVPANSTSSLRLVELKALQEKGESPVIKPKLTIISQSGYNQSIVFAVNLSMNDSRSAILEYDGMNGTYSTYNPNYGSCLNCVANIAAGVLYLDKGLSTFIFDSDHSSIEYGQRIQLGITAYDDEDGDGIPTDGDFNSSTYNPCTGSNNFCDDNCPWVYNPDQEDSNNDGVGDSCISVCSVA
ncbi:MAG: hypothetical protein Q7S74_00865 [Nanoarchaeota archaeon]|nr:hypothetical protein [Nanoarchaeota archaeon]